MMGLFGISGLQGLPIWLHFFSGPDIHLWLSQWGSKGLGELWGPPKRDSVVYWYSIQ